MQKSLRFIVAMPSRWSFASRAGRLGWGWPVVGKLNDRHPGDKQGLAVGLLEFHIFGKNIVFPLFEERLYAFEKGISVHDFLLSFAAVDVVATGDVNGFAFSGLGL